MVGVLKDSAVNKTSAAQEGLLSMEQVRPERRNQLQAYLEFKPGVAILPAAQQIAQDANIKQADIHKNTTLLEAMGQLGTVDWKSIGLAILVFCIALLVISNIYSMSVYRRIQDYGLLRAIGATKKQVGWLIIKEIVILLLIGIPPGILLGLASAQVFSGMAGNLFTEGEVHINKLAVTWQPMITGITAVTMAVLMAGTRTARLVFRIYPLEAIRKTMSASDKIRSQNSPRATFNWNITHSIVWQHLRRNKKSAALIVLSMTIGSVLLMLAAMYGSLKESQLELTLKASNFRSDFMINTSITVPMEQGFTPSQIKAMRKIGGVKQVSPVHVWYSQLLVEDEGNLDKKYFEYLNSQPYIKNVVKGVAVKDPVLSKTIIRNNLWGYTDEGFSELQPYLLQGEINVIKMKQGAEAIAVIPRPLKKAVYNTELEDTVTIRLKRPDGQYVSKNFRVAGIVAQMPYTDCFYTSDSSVDLIIPEKVFTSLTGYDRYRIINIDKYQQADTALINQQLQRIASTLPQSVLRDFSVEKDEIQNINKQIKMFLYGIVIVLFVIALFNIINSINYTFLSRIREFGLMRAVGLTKTQLRSMILFEGVVYGGISLVVSCLLGTILQLALFHFMNPGDIRYPILWPTYIAVILINMVIAALATGLPGLSISNRDVLESIREFE